MDRAAGQPTVRRRGKHRAASHCAQVGAALLIGLAVAAASGASAYATTVARVVFSGGRGQPVVALTFDDGNDATQLRLIFHILQATHVPATFFPFAQAMTLDPALWHSLAAAGYPIGNHTVTHPDLLRVSDAALHREIVGATAMIRAIGGRAPIPVFRPPFGAWDVRVAAAASAAGYPTLLLWDVDPRDWSGIPSPVIAQRVLTHTRGGSVVLLHVGPYHTAAALPTIIAGLARRGFRFVTVPQLLSGDLRGATVLSTTQIATLTAMSSPSGSVPRRSSPNGRSLSSPAIVARLERADVRGLAMSRDPPSMPHTIRRARPAQTSQEARGAAIALAVFSGAALLSALLVAAARRRKLGFGLLRRTG